MSDETSTSYQQALKTLKKIWGYDSLREGQDQAVSSILANQDTLVVLPTGGGKSICFQLPALVKEGMCLVISPLIALMKDQVQQLKDRGIQAESINSDDRTSQIEQKLINARNGLYRLLYVSPERLSTSLFQQFMKDLPLSFLAVDEAHCISEWGHEFRPSYREIVSHLPNGIQKVAVTATATPKVQQDIISVLNMQDVRSVRGNFVRPNLHWWVKITQRTTQELIQAALKAKGSGLIFCESRKQTEFYARKLTAKGDRIESYHAGYDADKRTQIQQRWTSNTTRVVSCTNAFGMGIDKPDCRFVLHGHLPSSIEAYYQEAGRAGRDLKTAYPLLFFNEHTYKRQIDRIEEQYPSEDELDKLYQVVCDIMDVALGEQQTDERFVSSTDIAISKRARLSPKTVYYGLNSLHDLGIIEFRQKMERSYRIILTAQEQEVDQNDTKAQFIDRIRRIYHAELRSDQRIVAKQLADLLQLSQNVLDRSLKVLMDEGRLQFEKYENAFQFRLLGNRQKKAPLNLKRLISLKERKLQKLDWMYQYVHTRTCRSQFIASYFGQDLTKPCGVCDNCKNAATPKNQLQNELLEQVIEKLPKTAEEAITEDAFLSGFNMKQQASLRRVLYRLLQEGVVVETKDQLLFCR